MRKSDKKIDNKLRKALTEICDFALQHSDGYQWITHSVNFQQFPESLIITCIFSDQQSADHAEQQGTLFSMIQQKLQDASVDLKQSTKQIRFESE